MLSFYCTKFLTFKGLLVFFIFFYIFYVYIYDKYILSEADKITLNKIQILFRKYINPIFIGIGLILFIFALTYNAICESTYPL